MMSCQNFSDLFLKIYNRYHFKECKIFPSETEDGRSWCSLEYKIIIIEKSQWACGDARSVFSLLHEIGHVMTNTLDMPRCDQEYLATKWAIDKMIKYGFDIEQDLKDSYQHYIFTYYINKESIYKDPYYYELKWN